MKTKAYAYLRVSSEGQAKDNKDGFPRQEQAIREYAKANNIQVMQVFSEPWTGREDSRPQLDEMMVSLDLNGHGVRTVIIERLDRLARSIITQEIIVADIVKGGYNLISTKEGQDLQSNDPDRVMYRQIIGVFNEYERAKLVNRLRLARLRKRKLTGKCEGRLSYSETFEGREIILRVRALRRKPVNRRTRSYQQIADILNAEGMTTLEGRPFTLHQVRRIYVNS